MPTQIQLKPVKTVEIEPESDVPAPVGNRERALLRTAPGARERLDLIHQEGLRPVDHPEPTLRGVHIRGHPAEHRRGAAVPEETRNKSQRNQLQRPKRGTNQHDVVDTIAQNR